MNNDDSKTAGAQLMLALMCLEQHEDDNASVLRQLRALASHWNDDIEHASGLPRIIEELQQMQIPRAGVEQAIQHLQNALGVLKAAKPDGRTVKR